MPDLGSWFQIVSTALALLLGWVPLDHATTRDGAVARFVADTVADRRANADPLDGTPPRRLAALDDETLDGPVPDDEALDGRRQNDRARGRRVEERVARQRAEDRAVRQPSRRGAGNGGIAHAEANGGTVTIGSIDGNPSVSGNATFVRRSTEDGVAIAVDASGDVATASQPGDDGTRTGPRARRQAAAPDARHPNDRDGERRRWRNRDDRPRR